MLSLPATWHRQRKSVTLLMFTILIWENQTVKKKVFSTILLSLLKQILHIKQMCELPSKLRTCYARVIKTYYLNNRSTRVFFNKLLTFKPYRKFQQFKVHYFKIHVQCINEQLICIAWNGAIGRHLKYGMVLLSPRGSIPGRERPES